MKVPDREITRVGNKMCAKGSRERGDEKRGRRQSKYYSTLADLDAHGGGGRDTAPLIPLSRASPGPTRPEFLYRHFRCAACGFSGNSESSNSPPPAAVFSNSSNPSPFTPCLVSDRGLLSASPAGGRCRFDRWELVREGSVSP
jgi:hypothetical protein